MVLKTMAFSTAFYLGTLWDAPASHAAKIRAMTRYFFWKGRMPAGITAKSRAGAYKCGTPVADEWLVYPPNQGGFGLWSPMDHLTAEVASAYLRRRRSYPCRRYKILLII